MAQITANTAPSVRRIIAPLATSTAVDDA